jgi:hypothetical protein
VLRRTLVTLGCAALFAGLAGFGTAAPARAHAAAGSCPDTQSALLAFNATRAWSIAGTKGGGVTIGVVGAPDRIAEAVCAINALAPDATVAQGSATGAIVVVTDSSVDPASIGGQALVVAAAGDTGEPMPGRPQGVVNVASADASGAPQQSSASGPQVTLAAYGNDTSTASGFAAALAAILRAGHANWPARQVVAQMAGSINPASGNPRTNQLGFGIIAPVQAVSQQPIDPESLPGFDAMFPANQPPRSGAAPSTRSAPTGGPSSAGAPASTPGATPAPSGTDSSPSATPSAPGTTDTANFWPTNQIFSTGPSNGSHAAAGGSGGSGGSSPVLLIGFVVILAGGGYLLWQRRRQHQPADSKTEEEWEAPSGPRHSGYSPPEE